MPPDIDIRRCRDTVDASCFGQLAQTRPGEGHMATMQPMLLHQLQRQITQGRAVVVVGAGVSIASTKGNPVASWKGLLSNGVEYCEQAVAGLPDGWAEHVRWQIASGDVEEMIFAAENISRRLGRPGGHYRLWLRSAFEDLHAADPSLLRCIDQLASLVATTNYDGLIEEVTKRQTRTWREDYAFDALANGGDRMVLHLHGYWEDPLSIVLGVRSYEDVLRSTQAQLIQKIMAATSTFIFVGFGAGLDDPNFSALRAHMAELFTGSGYGHFRLCTDQELAEYNERHAGTEPVSLVAYGDSVEKLGPFLEGLLGAVRQPPADVSAQVGEAIGDSVDEMGYLPRRSDAMIGRRADLRRLSSLLHKYSIVTITGMGGFGRSRLAVTAAQNWRDSTSHTVVYVDFAQAGGVTSTATVTAKALGISESPGQAPESAIIHRLRAQRTLLVLDHCEHRLDDVPAFVSALLSACPDLRILATSVRGLGVADEQLLPLHPLSLPTVGADPKSAGRADAVKLFVTRARERHPEFSLSATNVKEVIHICRSLEGWPLALELVARRVRVEDVRTIAESLPDVVRSDLWEVLDWDQSMLSEDQRRLFNHLSIYASAFRIVDAKACVNNDWDNQRLKNELFALVDLAFVVVVRRTPGTTHYRLLEPLAAYGRAKLMESGEYDRLQQWHAAYFLKMAETAYENHMTERRQECFEELTNFYVDIESALLYLSSTGSQDELFISCVGALFWYWNFSGQLAEGRKWLGKALSSASAKRGIPYARALYADGALAFLQGELPAARKQLTASVSLWRETHDRRGEAFALFLLGHVKSYQGEGEAGQRDAETAVTLLRTLDHKWGLALALNDLGVISAGRDDARKAYESFEEAQMLWRELKDTWGLALTMDNLAKWALTTGDVVLAKDAVRSALQAQIVAGDQGGRALSLQVLADIYLQENDYAAAVTSYRDSLLINQGLGRAQLIADCMSGIAKVAGRCGMPSEAGLLFGASDKLRNTYGVSKSAAGRARYDEDVKAARGSMSEADYREVRVRGERLLPEEVLAETLDLILSFAKERSESESRVDPASPELALARLPGRFGGRRTPVG
jgi:predicted ATPase